MTTWNYVVTSLAGSETGDPNRPEHGAGYHSREALVEDELNRLGEAGWRFVALHTAHPTDSSKPAYAIFERAVD